MNDVNYYILKYLIIVMIKQCYKTKFIVLVLFKQKKALPNLIMTRLL